MRAKESHHGPSSVKLAEEIVRLNADRDVEMARVTARFIRANETGNDIEDTAGELIDTCGRVETIFTEGLYRAFSRHVLEPDLKAVTAAEQAGILPKAA